MMLTSISVVKKSLNYFLNNTYSLILAPLFMVTSEEAMLGWGGGGIIQVGSIIIAEGWYYMLPVICSAAKSCSIFIAYVLFIAITATNNYTFMLLTWPQMITTARASVPIKLAHFIISTLSIFKTGVQLVSHADVLRGLSPNGGGKAWQLELLSELGAGHFLNSYNYAYIGDEMNLQLKWLVWMLHISLSE